MSLYLDAATNDLIRLADTAAQAVRAINHATIVGPPLPAPSVYAILGSLKWLGYGLDQATTQLAARLAESAGVFDLYECDGRNPGEQLAAATTALTEAAQHAHAVGVFLDQAQSAIAGQGFRD